MTLNDYFQAGYHGMTSHEPPYPSSPVHMAYCCGVWCKEHNIVAYEIKASRGYTWIVNRTYKLSFKNSSTHPCVIN
ncbi:MAG: hypothetical protein WC554_06870 [Clostridia bacterium]|jgi:hypothetical protein